MTMTRMQRRMEVGKNDRLTQARGWMLNLLFSPVFFSKITG